MRVERVAKSADRLDFILVSAERSLIAHAKRNGVELSDPPKEEPVFDMALPDTMRLEPALGKTVLAEDVPKLFADPNGAQWYGSRKLDGVRCLVVVDVEIEESEYFESSNIKVTRAKCYSRTGKAFHVLQPLLDDIEKLCTNWTDLIRILESEPSLSENTYKYKYLSGIFSENKRFVLDGELCVLKESKDEEGVLVEDFKEVVGKVRRKTGSADDIRMFILDMIPWSNFDRHANKGTVDMPVQQKSFSERQEDVIAVLQRMDDITIEGEDHSLLWLLQEPMNSPEEVEGLIATASEEGWEGIVLRRDVRYEGKRTYVYDVYLAPLLSLTIVARLVERTSENTKPG
jgi:DNA ligase-1